MMLREAVSYSRLRIAFNKCYMLQRQVRTLSIHIGAIVKKLLDDFQMSPI